jgi:hypothetical protein
MATTMLIFCDIVVAILKIATSRNCSMSGINSGHHYLPTQNGRHNTTLSQHCPISTPFHMWVDYDVPNWFLTLINFYRSPFSKWDIIIYPHIKLWWYWTMLIFGDIVVAILKMATSRNCSMSWINSGHHYLPTKNFYRLPFLKWPPQYHTNSTLPDFNAISHVGRLWCPELIPDIRDSILDIIIYPHIKLWWYRTMLNFCGIVAGILKMETGRNCSMSGINSGRWNIVRFQCHFICG